MTAIVKATDPVRRMGVYKRIEDVPDHYRLYHHAAAYDGRDVWAEYLEAEDERRGLSEWFLEHAGRAERRWKPHMEERGRHHALATPDDVEAWCETLLDDVALRTAYEYYWVKIEHFYTWLQFHADQPHVYHPVLMAAAAGGAAGKIWDFKIGTGRERAQERAESGRR